MERLVLIARLKQDAIERIRELVAEYRKSSEQPEFERFGIFLAEGEVVFYFEGPDADKRVREIVNDPVRSAEMSRWLPYFDGPLHRAFEGYYRERSG